MRAAWQILHRAGVPLSGEGREGPAPTPGELADAVRTVLALPPAGRAAEALAAFVMAWRSEFPSSFHAALGDDSARTLTWAAAQLSDDNRYLKLRRIAIAHLAGVL